MELLPEHGANINTRVSDVGTLSGFAHRIGLTDKRVFDFLAAHGAAGSPEP